MLANFHTHSTFCDGNNTPEEVVRAAIELGFSAIGFTSHGTTPFDLRYCMTDTEGYIAEIRRLKKEYREKIEIYLGLEEDAFAPYDRERFDYIIGSSHYLCLDGKYYPFDSSPDHFNQCLEAFDNDTHRLAKDYFGKFCAYIKSRRPDIIGHFDLITKYEELGESRLLCDPEYRAIAESAILEASKCGCIFEINMGGMIRGLRTKPYPSEHLLHVIKNQGARLILSSDSHDVDSLCGYFDEAKSYLRDLGFDHLYAISGGKFVEYSI